HRDAEGFLVEVIDGGSPVAELPLGQPRKCSDRQRDVVDDDRDAREAQPIADPVHAIAGSEAKELRRSAIDLGLRERKQLDLGVSLDSLLVDDMKEIE